MLPIGRAKIERPGKDVTITAFSIMVGKALQAAEELAKLGIEAIKGTDARSSGWSWRLSVVKTANFDSEDRHHD